MNKLDRWLLKRICKKLVIQGSEHKSRIAQYYKIMADAARQEFTEDNEPTLKHFLTECYEGALEESQDEMAWGQSYDRLKKAYLEKKRKREIT
jgi:hypothetical protein